MAQQKKRTSGSRSGSGAKKQTAVQKKRSHRGALAAVFLVLGLFTVLGYFEADGVFIRFLRRLMSGLFGGGFYLLPPALLMCGVFLLSHKRGAVSRAICSLLVPFMVGAFCQLFSDIDVAESENIFSMLWNDGVALHGGGALGGSVTILFAYLFSKIGTCIVLICLSVVIVLNIFGMTVPAAIELVRKKADEVKKERSERMEDEDDEYEADEKPEKTVRRRRSAIDIPLDETDRPTAATRQTQTVRPKKKLFNDQASVPRPDEFYSAGISNSTRAAEPEPEPVAEPAPEPVRTIPVEPAPEYETVSEPVAETARLAEMEDYEPEEIVSEPEPSARREPTRPPEPAPEPAVKAESLPRKKTSQSTSSRADPREDADDIQQLIDANARRDLDEAQRQYKYPPISLLNEPSGMGLRDSENELVATKERLERTLQSFGINAVISNIVNGPSITRYEMELEIGVKLNKLTGLAEDIALALGVGGVRIAAIPNRISTVGIEVPNKNVSTVYLREVITSPEFRNAKSKLTFAIGKNISGDIMIGDISKLPHLLVAGTTGSGKSVCLNSLILSLMYKATPDEVRFIMVDPKMVEFKIYNGIPHLLIPVVTEAKKAAGALQWAVTEMTRRYRLMSDMDVRDLDGYNRAVTGTDTPPLPRLVVIIDELADLMMVAAKDVEDSIVRVAQMGRAAGVHLVIATQSPRADVITGLMKANIPSRIALKVASSLESRIILDAGGSADKLVGNGDMLYAPTGRPKPDRIQGTWVSDEEREHVVEFVKAGTKASYSEDAIHQIEKNASAKERGNTQEPSKEEREYDELLPQAADVIFDTKQASVSMLQRRLKLGYARAARLVDQLEEVGVVGPFEGSKPRQILITKEQWHEMQFVNGTAPVEKAPSGISSSADDNNSYGEDK